jgi:hypothetical protein
MDPFIPSHFQKKHSGMQGTEYIPNLEVHVPRSAWVKARDYAIVTANHLHDDIGVTKQLANRILEPYMWVTMLFTCGEEGLYNFFNLRCPQYNWGGKTYKSFDDLYNEQEGSVEEYVNLELKGDWETFKRTINKGKAEIHMMELAECMYTAYKNNSPKSLQEGEWHVPFMDKIMAAPYTIIDTSKEEVPYFVRLSVAMAARTSYTTVGEEKEFNWYTLYELHDLLINQDPIHASPMEHQARAMTEDEYRNNGKLIDGKMEYGWCRNFRGFIQYRHILENK